MTSTRTSPPTSRQRGPPEASSVGGPAPVRSTFPAGNPSGLSLDFLASSHQLNRFLRCAINRPISALPAGDRRDGTAARGRLSGEPVAQPARAHGSASAVVDGVRRPAGTARRCLATETETAHSGPPHPSQSGLLGSDQAFLHRPHRDHGSISHVQLSQHVLHVFLDGLDADVQGLGDLAVAQAEG